MTQTLQPLTPASPRAYSYLRFSSPEQMKGDSFRRQKEMAAAYAAKLGLELDTELTFHDLGVSAFRGKNSEAGRLADFLEAVETGLVPQGSILLVEQLDRVSRLVARKAIKVLERIIEAGVAVVTLNDGRKYDLETIDTDQISFLVAILTFMRANEESETKSKRGSQSWAAKRAKLGTVPMTSKAPAWLSLDREAGVFVPIPERAQLVERIFAMTLEGVGQHKIAETFNREGLAPWGSAQHWQRSYIAKVLNNSAVIGTLVPHVMEHADGRKSRRALEPVLGYYPSVIARETFAEVQVLQAAHSAPSRGRHAHTPICNILAGLAVCPVCERSMTRVQKGVRSKPAFVCSAAKVGAGCAYKSVPYQAVEDHLVLELPAMLADRDGANVPDRLDRKIDGMEQRIEDLNEDIENLVEILEGQRSKALAARLLLKEAELEAARSDLKSLVERLELASGPVIAARIAKAISALKASAELFDREAINRGLRSLFSKAVINWPAGSIDLEWTHGGLCRVYYRTAPSARPTPT